MKKHFTIFFFFLLLFAGKPIAQDCLPNGLTLNTQGQIDSFSINYPGCTVILGNLTIKEEISGGITNLLGLSSINSIEGNLVIGDENTEKGNSSLVNLRGLENLKDVGGYCIIAANDSLKSLDGLNNVTSVTGFLGIAENPSLTNLNGLENLTSLAQGLLLFKNSALLSLEGLNQLMTINGGLVVSSNNVLTNLNSLENLTSILGNLYVNDNNSLTSFSGLDNVSFIQGNISVRNNPGLTSLKGLDNLTSVTGYLRVETNISLTTLSGLKNLIFLGGNLLIYRNPKMLNLIGLNSLDTIKGDLQIVKNDVLENLKGLNKLKSIGGYFLVRGNNTLLSLYGIDNVNNFKKRIVIDSNYQLSVCNTPGICDYLNQGPPTTINNNAPGCNNVLEIKATCHVSPQGCFSEGILFDTQSKIDSFAINYPECTRIFGNVTIQESVARNITNLLGLAQIDSILGDLQIGDRFDWCSGFGTSLSSLRGLDNLSYIAGALSINCNDLLTNLNGLNNLTSTGHLGISNNASLNSLMDLNNLYTIDGFLGISGNQILNNLSGLDNLTTVGALGILNNASLSSLNNLKNLTSVTGNLGIVANHSLNNLSGLDNIISIGDDLVIRDNDALTNLNSLRNLSTIGGGALEVSNNASLTSLSGLDRIDPYSITLMEIIDNPQLSVCQVTSICDYLQTGNPVNLFNNAIGCEDVQEVIQACQTSTEDLSDKKERVHVFPNPTDGNLNIICDDNAAFSYSVRSSFSMPVFSGIAKGRCTIDISVLPDGFYILEIMTNHQLISKKIIKTKGY